MRHLLVIFVSASMLFGCKNVETTNLPQIKFTVKQHLLQSDTTICSIAVLNDKIICLQSNGKLIILGSNYQRQSLLERKLNVYKFSSLITLHDTVFISSKTKTYFFDKVLGLTEVKSRQTIYGNPLYEDSLYYVYGCCAGEWGGAVFFLDKHNQKTFSYFATCGSQVLKFKNEYIVCNNLAHLDNSMSFLFVPNPSWLYELNNEKLKNNCNWYAGVDSLKGYYEKSEVGRVRFYRGTRDAMSLVTFPVKDSLYSIICGDDSTYIAVHTGDTTLARQTVFNKRTLFHSAQVISMGRKQFCLFNLTGGSPFAAYTTLGNNSGMVVVDGTRIDILTQAQKAN